ncbi:hypothetical protein BDR22DRAFT_815273, partial [Usnea florida]
RKRLKKYFSTISNFLEKLLILFYIIEGSPAYTLELLNIRLSNSINSGVRNIFFEDGLIYFIIYYYKDYAI